MELSDYEKAMLIMQMAQVRMLHEIAQTISVNGWDKDAEDVLTDMDRQIGQYCTEDVLLIVSPLRDDPHG